MKMTIDTYTNAPYNGLFGETNQIKVIRQVIADPFGDYRPKELEALIEASAPSVRRVLKNLTRVGLLIKDTRDRQHPVYRVNVDSPIYLALNFLAFAILDHKNSTHYMNDAIADYYYSELRGHYEPDEILSIESVSQESFEANPEQSDVAMDSIPFMQDSTWGTSQNRTIYKLSSVQIQEPLGIAA